MTIRPIKTEADHAAAVAELDTLMDAEPGSEAFDRLEVLSMLVDAYEAKAYPIDPPDPVDAILFRMEQLGWTRQGPGSPKPQATFDTTHDPPPQRGIWYPCGSAY